MSYNAIICTYLLTYRQRNIEQTNERQNERDNKLKTVKHLTQIALMIMIMTSGWGLQQWPTSPITKSTVH